jgi:hypothetical protein
VADSLGLQQFLQIGLDENTPDRSTIFRTRRLISIETHGTKVNVHPKGIRLGVGGVGGSRFTEGQETKAFRQFIGAYKSRRCHSPPELHYVSASTSTI